MSTPLLMTIAEAADVLSCSARALWSLTRAGAIPHLRLGSLVRYSRDDLDAWLAAGRAERIAALKPLPPRKAKRDRRAKRGAA